ncbi:TetR/AcrR family transcriptional regulator [Nonomuraea diastatica]|uniref:TetR/AcrR family transcriptional regulator n=1 Tax=Nonomuraea diastatica TaxID=1848329 RepID=A0A4R4WRS3_9ACTN|nr:TetR/AcrR family transcriptional regulator [Nonomuraea diastatica]TDD18940.1 TetR/AcrR family transcriptional regulator [Nonomuraea diastatica]
MTSDQKLRADARLNREQIIEAAHALIAEHGADVPMEEVARRAGVGTGTLYRRFPNRHALIRGVALDSFRRVIAIARTAEDEEPDAWAALTRFVHQAGGELRLAAGLAMRFAGTWATLRDDPENLRLRAILLKILDRLVRRAQAEGKARDDVSAADLSMMMALLLRPMPGLQPDLTPAGVDRYLTLMLEGLRARPDTAPLPSPEITVAGLA